MYQDDILMELYVVIRCVTQLAYFHNNRNKHQHNAKSGLFIQIA